MDLPEDHPVRRYGEEKMELLDRVGYASSKAGEGGRARRDRPGWNEIPSSAPADRPPRPAMTFEGRSVLVTGGSRGIGRAIARRFAELGAARVAVGYLRNDAAAEEAADKLRSLGAEPVLVRGNVTSSRVIQEVEALGPARRARPQRRHRGDPSGAQTDDRHWEWTLGANARALLSLARVAAPSMPAGSSIVGISSLGSTRVLENYVLVGTSKAALESLVRYLAVELAPRGIRVETPVSGGIIETGALDHFPNREQMLEAARKRTPAGRMVEAADLADAVVFLCSPEAEMVRGHTLVVDGGYSLLA